MDNIVKRLLPNAVYGWLGLNGEPAPLGQELRIWDKTKGRYLEIQLHDTTYISEYLGYYDIIFFGANVGDEVEVHAYDVSYGSFIIENGEIYKLNIDLGYPMQYGILDLNIIDQYGNPLTGDDIFYHLYFSTVPWWRGGRGGWSNLIQGEYHLSLIVRPDRPFIAPPDYYFSILRGQTITDTIIVERTAPEKAHINVNSIPSGANIYLNENYLGQTNSSHEIDHGTHILKLTLEGYYDYEEQFSIVEGETRDFNITLTPIEEPPLGPIEPLEWKKNGVSGTPPIEIRIGDEASCLARFTNPLDVPLDMGIALWVSREGRALPSQVKRVGVIAPGESIIAETNPVTIRDYHDWSPGYLRGILFMLRGSDANDRVETSSFFDIYDYVLQPQGFLQIANINAPIEAFEGEIVNVILTLTNIGVADNFRYVARDNTTGEILMQGIDTFVDDESKNVEFNFIMPNQDMTINVTTEHEE